MPIYMKFPGAKGTGKGKYDGWVELEAVQFGGQRPPTSATGLGSQREASSPTAREIVVTKLVDTASPDLVRLSQSGQGVKVTTHFVAENSKPPAPYRSIELEGTLIVSYSARGSDGLSQARPIESLSLNASSITVSNTPGKPSTDPRQHPDRAMSDLVPGLRGS